MQNEIDNVRRADNLKRTNMLIVKLLQVRSNKLHPNPQGWRHLPSVKKCLDGLCIGERDNALCAACYAMDKNGYKEHIPEFLDECVVESSFKDKWRKRYSR